MVYLRTLERERELKEEGREEGLVEGRKEGREEGRVEGREEGRVEGARVTESRYKPILKQKDDLIEQKNTEITKLKALLAAHDIREA